MMMGNGNYQLSQLDKSQKSLFSLMMTENRYFLFLLKLSRSTRSSECQRTKEVCRLVYGTNAEETDANLFLSCVNKGHATPIEEEGRQKNPEANNSKKKMKKYKGPTPEVACELGA